jgi:hypothetical protein
VTAAVLVETLRARGIHLRAVGDRIRYRPASALTPEDLETLRQQKAEVLKLLLSTTPPPSQPVVAALHLDGAIVREVLGQKPDPHDLAILKLDVMQAVATLKTEVQTGTIGQHPLLVRGRPLGDWLDLDIIAGLLKLGQRR